MLIAARLKNKNAHFLLCENKKEVEFHTDVELSYRKIKIIQSLYVE